MISRKTTISLAEVYIRQFTRPHRDSYGSYKDRVIVDSLYDFLYEKEFEAWICNILSQFKDPSALRKAIMKIHTAETLLKATPDWTMDSRKNLSQKLLQDLAEAILVDGERPSTSPFYTEINAKITTLTHNLELDGYSFRNSRLFVPESDVLDVEEEVGLLESLYLSLKLGNKRTADHHLHLSEKHYVDSNWDDSISNSRKYLENVLQEIAAAHSLQETGTSTSNNDLSRPVFVRDYLEEKGLLERKEKEALAKIYGLLSDTGGHPYIAENDQARLMRHLALTFSQFVMLRFEGYLSKLQRET